MILVTIRTVDNELSPDWVGDKKTVRLKCYYVRGGEVTHFI